MNFDGYRIKLNMKSICYYEKISGKSFFKLSNDDIPKLLYACWEMNNPNEVMSYNMFETMLKNKKFAKWISETTNKIFDIINQFNDPKETEEEETESDTTITEIVSGLIVKMRVDAHYVMYDMDLFEIEPFFKQYDALQKEKLMYERLWTYLTILPNIDGKKCKSPSEMFMFPWEEDERKKKYEEDLKREAKVAKNIVGKTIDELFGWNKKKETEEDNG